MTNVLLYFIISALVALGITCVTLYYLIPYLKKKAFLDIPNERSSHTKITPRGGGIGLIAGIFAGSLTACFFGLPVPHFTFFAGLILMAVTSFFDDRKSLPVFVRLSAHILAMGMVIYYTGGLKTFPFAYPLNFEVGYLGYLISAIWIIAVINFFNFMDGIDGIAGSQAMLGGLAITTIFWGSSVAVIGICIALASLGFLFYNWHPAKVFMGDVGSISLGFAFATLPFYSEVLQKEEGVFSIAIFLWFFLADAAFTMIRRLLNKERIWEAHRSHLYQRLNKSGWPHDKIVMVIMVFTIILSGVQIFLIKTGNPLNWVSVIAGILLFLLYLVFVSSQEKKA